MARRQDKDVASGAAAGKRPAGRIKRLAQRLALLFGTFLLLLLVAEVTLRVLGVPPRTPTVIQGFFQWHPRTGWAGRPGAAQNFVTSDFDVWIAHDEDGLRRCAMTTRIGEDASSGTEVVWCVGDSTTWGWGVVDEESWVTQLDRADARRSYRNLGAPGYSTVQECIQLEERFARGEKPSAVLLLYCSNDAEENVQVKKNRPYVELGGDGPRLANTEVKENAWKSLHAWLTNNVMVFNHLHYYWMVVKRGLATGGAAGEPGADPAPMPEHHATALRFALTRIRDRCATEDVAFWIATPYRAPQLGAICGHLGVPFFDLAPYWEAHRDGPPVNFGRDSHWNRTGNKIVAGGLRAEIEKLAKR